MSFQANVLLADWTRAPAEQCECALPKHRWRHTRSGRQRQPIGSPATANCYVSGIARVLHVIPSHNHGSGDFLHMSNH